MKRKLSIFLLSVTLLLCSCGNTAVTTEGYSSINTTTTSATTQTTAGTTTQATAGTTTQATTTYCTSTVQTPTSTTTNADNSTTAISEDTIIPDTSISETTSYITTTQKPIEEEPEQIDYENLLVHFIDVGQGDSCFIELPNGETMLIDAGEAEYSDTVVTYVYSQGYDTINYVVATHPHSDHIGGMSTVINSFNIDNIYMTSFSTTTQVYEDLLNAAENSGADIYEVMAGSTILNEPNLLVEVVAPKEISDDCNNNSIVIKLTYDEKKFLFTGDAEKAEEDGIWTNIKCDVLKVGHHGSDSSSSANFLKKVEPTYAIISCGLHNSYGHPTDKVLNRLYDRNINVYRTDIQGTIIVESDGKTISVNKQPVEYTPPVQTTTSSTNQSTTSDEPQDNPSSEITYVLNTNSKRIHYPDCSSVDKMKEKNKGYTTDFQQAIADGYKPCGNCHPTG